MKITLYKGYHSKQAYQTFLDHIQSDNFLIYLPPTLNDYSFTEFLPKADLIPVGELWQGDESFPAPTHPADQLQPGLGVFSSGTTASSKLVLYSKDNLLASTQGIYSLFDQKRLKKIFCYPQPFHTFGLTLGYAASHFLNLELIFPMGSYSRKAHQTWLEQIDNSTLTLGTPTHFQDLITTLASESADVSPSYSCIIGGAKVKKQLWLDCQDQLKIEAPSIGYGATEASPGLTHLSPGEKPEMDGEIGRVLDHVQLEIHPSGLSFSGRNLCYGILEEGKWSHPRQYHLPDIVEGLNGSDKLLYLTRANWFLNRGGEKFSLEKIEKTIFDGLKLEALACALPDERLGEELGLLVLNKHGASQELKEKVISVLKEKTLRNFPIENIQFVEDWPYNDSMKKDRRKARRFFTKEN